MQDLLQWLATESILSKLQKGELKVKSIEEFDGNLALILNTDTKEQAVAAATSQIEKPVSKKAKRKLHRSPEARAELHNKIFDTLSATQPMSTVEIGKKINMGYSSVLTALREMDGYVEEVSGNKYKNFKFVRKPIPISS